MPVVVHLLGHAAESSCVLSHPHCRGALFAAVEEAAEIWGVAFYAYALTDRYLHLVTRITEGSAQRLSGSMVATIARVARTSHGGVSAVRFDHMVLADDAALIDAVCYAHRSSWRCGQVPRPAADPWSSLRAYQGCEPLLRPMRIAPVLDALNRCADPADAYARFMDHAVSPGSARTPLSMEPPAARAQDPGSTRTLRRAQGRAEPEPPLHPGERIRRRVRST
jgi:hypothetical protein